MKLFKYIHIWLNIMTNFKENKLDQMKQDLGDIESDAKELEIGIPQNGIGNDRLMLTEVVQSSNSKDFFSNSEILSELHKLQACLDSQQKILSNMFKKIE